MGISQRVAEAGKSPSAIKSSKASWANSRDNCQSTIPSPPRLSMVFRSCSFASNSISFWKEVSVTWLWEVLSQPNARVAIIRMAAAVIVVNPLIFFILFG